MSHPPKLPPLDDGVLGPDPIVQFKEWYDVAVKAGVPQADAMILATATKEGCPSARTVLLKAVDGSGFVFYTNYESRKGLEIAGNPRGALVFLWNELGRSVRVEGSIEKVTATESDVYFATRPRDGQLSSLASRQSGVVESRAMLDRRFDELSRLYEGKEIPRPSHWGGYRLTPRSIEFWQARFARMNDRILYELRADNTWSVVRLSP
jgi:pyridoxamine 5'-phosphate oxidase